MPAKIYKSPWGNTYRVEERIGNTILYTNHETIREAIYYCEQNGKEYVFE